MFNEVKVSLFFLFTLLVISTAGGEVFYQTGFEAANEPYGNFRKDRIPRFNVAPGVKIIEGTAQSGSQCITPGPGSGQYGNILTQTFPEKLISDEIWFDCYVRSEDDVSSGYKSFIYINGNSKDHGSEYKMVSVLFYQNKILVNEKIFPYSFPFGKWINVKIHINILNQNYELSVDGNKIGSFKFKDSDKMESPANALTRIILGGGASKDYLTFYDDLYIGSADKSATSGLKNNKTENALQITPYFIANKANKPPVIDGRLDDECWNLASCMTPFLKINGELENQQQTIGRICYDNDYLYVAFKCFDINLDPVLNQLEKIKSEKNQRDSGVFSDDSVEVFLAPFKDMPDKYFHIAVNSKGTIYDSALPEPGMSWNPEISTAVSIGEKSWDIEIKIPIREIIKSPVKDGDKWRINLCRNRSAANEITTWSPTSGSFHATAKFGMMEFLKSSPAVRNISVPEKLKDGTNKTSVEIHSAGDSNIILSQKLFYEGADEVDFSSDLKVTGGKSDLSSLPFTVSTEDDSRKNARKCSLRYSVFDAGTGHCLYVSPLLGYELPRYSPFRSNLVSDASGVYFNYTKEIYIAEKQAVHRMLLIQRADDVSGKFKECRCVFDTPSYIRILNSVENSTGQDSTELNFTEEQYMKDGKKRNRYTLTVPEKFTYSMKKMGFDNRYQNRINLIFYADMAGSMPENDVIEFYTEASEKEKSLKEAPVKIPLKILAPVKGKMPSVYPLISSFGNYNLSISKLPVEGAEKCLDTIASAGFNVFSICAFNNYLFSEERLQLVKKKIPRIERGFFLQHKSYIKDFLSGQEAFLQQYPQYKAVTHDGCISDKMVSIEHLLDDNGEYRAYLKKSLSDAAMKYDIILWDNENDPLSASSTCYSPKSIESFKKFASLKDDIKREDIKSKYREQWIAFQCARNARLAAVMSDIIKKVNPKCLFNVYSGYHGFSSSRYGTEWKLMAPSIDYAECGYDRPLAEIKETLKDIAPKKLISGELIMTWAGDINYNFDELKLKLFRRITDSNGGLLVFYDMQVDGRFWNAMSDLSRLISDYETFFIDWNRDDSLLLPISGFSREDYAVLRNKAGERIIFLFNNSGSEKEFKFKNAGLLSKHVSIDYYEKRKINMTDDMAVKIKGFDVKVIVIESKK